MRNIIEAVVPEFLLRGDSMNPWEIDSEFGERDHLKPGALVELDFVTEPKMNLHRHENFELLFVVSGEIELETEGDSYHLERGDMAVINVGMRHSYRSSASVVLARFLISCTRVRELLGMSTVLFWCNSTVDQNEAYDGLRRVISQILNEVVCNGGDNRLLLSSLHYQMLHLLVENFILSPHDERFVAEDGDEDDRMRRIYAYVRENYRESISLRDIADLLFLSPTYVSKYIKQQCGVGFVQLLNSVRLVRAVEDMMYSEDPITKIALDNGFASVSAFNKVFKDLYQQTPSEFRRSHREGGSRPEAEEQARDLIKQRVQDYLEDNDVADASETAHELELTVDMGEPTRARWNYNAVRIINVGTAADLLNAGVQEQMLAGREAIGFKYVRFWDLFDQEMYLDIHTPEESRNYSRLDAVTDFLVSNRFKPYIDLGFKPRRVIRTTTDVVRDQAEVDAVLNVDEAERFYRELFEHFIKRYGSWEIRSWFFEYWERPARNEGNVGTLLYAQMTDEDHRAYFARFDAVARVLRSLLPESHIGGAGFPVRIYGREAFTHVLTIWREFEQRPDFITLSCYPYQQEKVGSSYYEKRSSDLGFVRYGIELAQQAIADARFPETPVHVTEFNLSLSNRNVLNDSCLKASYLLFNTIDCVEKTDFLCYAMFSDFFAEGKDTGTILFGGGGLLTKDGAAKPAYNALSYLHLLYPGIQKVHRNCLITRNDRGSIRLVCHNLKKPNYNYYRAEEDALDIEDLPSLLSDNERLDVRMRINGIADGSYVVKTHVVNRDHGSIQDKWLKMGMESNLTPKEMEYLRGGSLGEIAACRCEAHDGRLELHWSMSANEIRYMHIYQK